MIWRSVEKKGAHTHPYIIYKLTLKSSYRIFCCVTRVLCRYVLITYGIWKNMLYYLSLLYYYHLLFSYSWPLPQRAMLHSPILLYFICTCHIVGYMCIWTQKMLRLDHYLFYFFVYLFFFCPLKNINTN